MEDMQFYHPFNTISVRSSWRKGNYEDCVHLFPVDVE